MPVRFILGVHAHQPVGNLPEVFETAHQRSYLPLFETLREYPIPLAVHISGVLFDWLEQAHPEFLDRLGRLAAAGQVELLTGGYGEPILAAIPDADKLGQIERMSLYLRRRFGIRPRGLWLAERVWEPHLAKLLVQAGVEYAVLDDHHFRAAGLPDEALTGYFLTEEQGATLALFPISQRLRYLIPFKEPEESLAYFRERAGIAPGGLAVMADDAEKFGGWPGTHDWVYRRGWLRRFLTALVESDAVTLTTFGAALADPPRGRVYLPTVSYAEMGEWALPSDAGIAFDEVRAEVERAVGPERARPFLRGGFWRTFLAKYPEANRLHKRMLGVSRAVHAMRGGAAKQEALAELWRSQCNDAYWHGVFGGLYLPHLRHAVYHHLLRAERAAEGAPRRSDVRVEVGDLDGDGTAEAVLTGRHLVAMVEPARGGAVTELSARDLAFNLGNTLTRRPEAYHRKVAHRAGPADGAATIHDEQGAKEAGLDRLLTYDAYPRASFVDHWLPADASPASFARSGGPAGLATAAYTLRVGRTGGLPALLLTASHTQGGAVLRVRKRYRLAAGAARLTADYQLEAEGGVPPSLFGVELNLAFYMGPPPDRTVEIDGAPAQDPSLLAVADATGVRELVVRDGWLGLAARVSVDPAATAWRCPVFTISQSEAGYERVAQQVAVLLSWPLKGPGAIRRCSITLALESEQRR
jgi:alpha-amylase